MTNYIVVCVLCFSGCPIKAKKSKWKSMPFYNRHILQSYILINHLFCISHVIKEHMLFYDVTMRDDIFVGQKWKWTPPVIGDVHPFVDIVPICPFFPCGAYSFKTNCPPYCPPLNKKNRASKISMPWNLVIMAEWRGFEPPLGCPTNDLANRPLQPLEYHSESLEKRDDRPR